MIAAPGADVKRGATKPSLILSLVLPSSMEENRLRLLLTVPAVTWRNEHPGYGMRLDHRAVNSFPPLDREGTAFISPFRTTLLVVIVSALYDHNPNDPAIPHLLGP